jgi:hypothetical protein
LATILTLTFLIWRTSLHCCSWFLYDSTFFTSSWVMVTPN